MFQLLLQERIATVIEAIRQNSDKYNNLVVSNTSSSATPQQSPLLHIEGYKNTLLDMANRLYDKLVKHFTISIITNVALNTTSLLSSPQSSSTFSNLSTQSYSYRIEKSESFHHSKGDTDD